MYIIRNVKYLLLYKKELAGYVRPINVEIGFAFLIQVWRKSLAIGPPKRYARPFNASYREQAIFTVKWFTANFLQSTYGRNVAKGIDAKEAILWYACLFIKNGLYCNTKSIFYIYGDLYIYSAIL